MGVFLGSHPVDVLGGQPVSTTANLQEKNASAATTAQRILPDAGYDGMSRINIAAATLQNKNVTPTESSQQITADTGNYGLGTVTVGAISSTYIGSSITQRDETDLSASGATVTVPAGYYAEQKTKSVRSGSVNNPTASKGTVSNHAIAITPSVTSSSGYIIGDTKTGSSVTVSASELVSGSQTFTENGTVDVTTLAQAVINVTGGGSGLEYETGTWEPESDIARGAISFTNTHTEAPILVALSDSNAENSTTANTNVLFVYFDPYKIFGTGYPYTASAFRYAIAYFSYRGTSSTSAGSLMISHNSDSTTNSGTSYTRYWASPTDFHPYSNSTSRYWRGGRTYKWIAVWKPK
jgi:hypothetical protein